MTTKKTRLGALVLCAVVLAAACGAGRVAGLTDGVRASQDGLWDDAIARWQASLAANPNSAALHNNLAVAYEAKGRRDDADKEYAAARRIAPDDERIRENLARFERVQDLEQPLSALADEPENKDERSGRVARVSFLIQGPAAADVRGYRKIQVTNFKQDVPAGDFDFDQWLGDYLTNELRRVFQGEVERSRAAWDGGARLDDPQFWKANGTEGSAFLTGSLTFRTATAKALRKADMLKDGPFGRKDRGLAERHRFTTILDVSLIPAATGQAVFRQEFKESEFDDTGSRSNEVAFAALLDKIKLRLFQALFGTELRAVRYLLAK